MKKYPRWAAMLMALTVILTSILTPLEGIAAPGPIKFQDDPKSLLGEPDSPPYATLPVLQFVPLDFMIRVAIALRADAQAHVAGASKVTRQP